MPLTLRACLRDGEKKIKIEHNGRRLKHNQYEVSIN